MVNIFGLNVFMTTTSLLTIGIVALVVVGVVATGSIVGAYKGGKHAIKSKAAKKELGRVRNSVDTVELKKGNNAVEENNKEETERLEAERKSNLEASAQNLDNENAQPVNQENNVNKNVDALVDDELKEVLTNNENSENGLSNEDVTNFLNL